MEVVKRKKINDMTLNENYVEMEISLSSRCSMQGSVERNFEQGTDRVHKLGQLSARFEK